jgi:hypothetical protein
MESIHSILSYLNIYHIFCWNVQQNTLLPLIGARSSIVCWSQKVVGLIPDEATVFFNWPNPFSCTMALGLTQPLTEMSTRNLCGSKGSPARKADNLPTICESIVYKMWEPRCLTSLWESMACYRDSFTFWPLTSHPGSGTFSLLILAT